MKIFPSIFTGFSLAAAAAAAAAPDDVELEDEELVPTMSPSSWFPSSYPAEFLYNPDFGCPDRHEGIVLQLYKAFGRENCENNSNSETGSIHCTYTDPNWFQGNANYEYRVSDVEYHRNWIPMNLFVSDTNLYQYSGASYVYFDQPLTEQWERDHVENGGKCMDHEGFLDGIWGKRLRPQDAPRCNDTVGDFKYTKKTRNGKKNSKKSKTTSCDDLWKSGLRSRRKKCSKHPEIRSNCPGVCERFDVYPYDPRCFCKDYPFPFVEGEKMSCAELAEADNKGTLCEMNSYKYNCPSVCSYECRKNF